MFALSTLGHPSCLIDSDRQQIHMTTLTLTIHLWPWHTIYPLYPITIEITVLRLLPIPSLISLSRWQHQLLVSIDTVTVVMMYLWRLPWAISASQYGDDSIRYRHKTLVDLIETRVGRFAFDPGMGWYDLRVAETLPGVTHTRTDGRMGDERTDGPTLGLPPFECVLHEVVKRCVHE